MGTKPIWPSDHLCRCQRDYDYLCRSGGNIYLATHDLKDGTYWIHWLAKGNAETIYPKSVMQDKKAFVFSYYNYVCFCGILYSLFMPF